MFAVQKTDGGVQIIKAGVVIKTITKRADIAALRESLTPKEQADLDSGKRVVTGRVPLRFVK